MSDPQTWTCHACGNVGLANDSDGFFYCKSCGTQAEGFVETGVADEDFIGGETGGALYLASHSRRRHSTVIKAEPISLIETTTYSQSLFWNTLTQDNEEATPLRPIKKEEFDDGMGPTGPEDFGSSVKDVGPSFEDYYNEIRIRYVMGVQMMIEFQCQSLVREFEVSPLICGLAGTLWMRFVAGTGVFEDDWADQTIQNSEMHRPEEPEDHKPSAKYSSEPHNMYGQRAVMIWYRSLRRRIPLSCSLAISFLACHIAREAILPTDIVKWSLEGKLPYFTAFLEIEKNVGKPSSACPIGSSVMFKPSQVISFQTLESMAASVAQSIGLDLPPVNFYAIASRYLHKLPISMEKILPHACRIYEWSMPPDLWLSTNELRLPTRVCVMSILIVAIRILYNIHGFGEWEKSLSNYGGSSSISKQTSELDPMRDSNIGDEGGMESGSPSHDVDDLGTNSMRNSSQVQKSELDAAELLHKLEASNKVIADTYEYSKDLPTYLQYCKDVVFAGLEPSFEDHEEEKLTEEFWDFYQNEEDSEVAEDLGEGCKIAFNQKRLRDEECISHVSKDKKKIRDEGCASGPSSDDGTYHEDGSQRGLDGDHSSQSSQGEQNSELNDQASAETLKNDAIRRMKLEMEENRFCYIPPRVSLKRFDYLHYVRKRDEGALTYVAHADYYILLRACARAVQVDIRLMHIGVLSLERRLAWFENRIEHCLHLTPPTVYCEFCSDVAPEHAGDDSTGLADLNI